MYDKLLIPLDGSEISEVVIPYALELAKRCGSKVTLLQTIDPHAHHAEQPAAEAYLASVAARFKAEGIEADCVVRPGAPGETILQYADTDASQVIAMASHGRGGLNRVLHGSVAEHVMRNAKVQVLYVRYIQPDK
jgi:nucleotide-binding universal stress UspA family protein